MKPRRKNPNEPYDSGIIGGIESAEAREDDADEYRTATEAPATFTLRQLAHDDYYDIIGGRDE